MADWRYKISFPVMKRNLIYFRDVRSFVYFLYILILRVSIIRNVLYKIVVELKYSSRITLQLPLMEKLSKRKQYFNSANIMFIDK